MITTVFSLVTALFAAALCAILFITVASRLEIPALTRLLAMALYGIASGISVYFAWGYWRILAGTLSSRDAGEEVFRDFVPGLFTTIAVMAGFIFVLLLDQQNATKSAQDLTDKVYRLQEKYESLADHISQFQKDG